MIKDAEKSRPELKPSESKAKKNKVEKPEEDILSRLDYFEMQKVTLPWSLLHASMV